MVVAILVVAAEVVVVVLVVEVVGVGTVASHIDQYNRLI